MTIKTIFNVLVWILWVVLAVISWLYLADLQSGIKPSIPVMPFIRGFAFGFYTLFAGWFLTRK